MNVDFLVLGSGLAGVRAALELSHHGTVVLASKRQIDDNATSFAQGGIAAAVDSADTCDLHAADTVEAGAGLCDAGVVRSIVGEGPRAVADLVALGVAFDRGPAGYDLTREGGHHARRVLHSQDMTGRAIDQALRRKLAASPVRLLTDHIAVDFITARKVGAGSEDRCLGAHVLNSRTGEVATVRARATLLATGGAGKAYLYTSNPDIATGDGVAMAFRAGAVINNMEFFQFHPTCVYHPRAKSFLITEAMRGEGGVLRSLSGTPVMRDVHPMGDLAPRDVVARAIDRHMKCTGEDHVLLDVSRIAPETLRARFPNILQSCLGWGIDILREPIPVVPAAHYSCGGVDTDLSARTSLPGLWAAGEVAHTGLHGANRLASNSLLEAAVMGARAAADMVSANCSAPPVVPAWDTGNAGDPDEAVVVSHNWDELRRVMWNYVGIVRSDRRLARAATRIDVLQEEIREYYWDFKLTHDLVELRNLAEVARLMIHSALRRRESRGLHFNIDVPQTDQRVRHSRVRRGPRGALVWLDG
jgi:L-aspartate oxidase